MPIAPAPERWAVARQRVEPPLHPRHYRHLIALRCAALALAAGGQSTLSAGPDVFCYPSHLDEECSLVLIDVAFCPNPPTLAPLGLAAASPVGLTRPRLGLAEALVVRRG